MPNVDAIRRLASANKPGPKLLPGLALWYKADSLNLPDATNVGTAHTWFDSSGNGHDLTTNPSGTPVFKLNQVGALPAISFGGSVNLGMSNSITLGNCTILVAYKSSAGADGNVLGNTGINRQVRINRSAANQCSFYDGTTEAISATFSTSITSRRLVTWRRSGSAVDFYENVTPQTGGTSSNSVVLNNVGNASGIFFAGLLYEVAVYSRALSNAEIVNLYNSYFKSRWQLP